MKAKDLDEDLNDLRDCIIQATTAGEVPERTNESLLDVADKLETAQHDQVPGEVKAAVLSAGRLALRAARLPAGSIDGLDFEELVSILQGRAYLQ